MVDQVELVERVARALWHRFACGSVETWDDETAKAEYRDAAKGALEASHHAELVEALAYWMSREHMLPDITIDDVVFRTKSRDVLAKIHPNNTGEV